MGVISDLVQMKSQKDAAAKVGALEALKTAMSNPNISPEGYNWATQSIIDIASGTFGEGGKGKGASKGGDKGGVGGFFQHLLGGLQRMNPYQANPGMKAGIAEEMKGTSRNPRPEHMFLDQNEQDFLKQQQLMASEQIKNQMALQYDREKGQAQWEQGVKHATEMGLKPGSPEFVSVVTGRNAPGSNWKPVVTHDQIDPEDPEGGTKTRYSWPDGTATYIREGAKPVAPKDPLSQIPTAERGIMWANEHINDPDPIVRKTAQAAQKAFELTQKSKEVGITVRMEGAAEKREVRKSAGDLADAIVRGEQPPVSEQMTRDEWTKVRIELAKKGYNLAKAELDWKAVNRHLATLNGPQQLKMRQSVKNLQELVPSLEYLYADWKKKGTVSGIKIFNRAAMELAKNKGGEAGAAAQALDSQIIHTISDLGQVYMGGTSNTDHSLDLAAKALQGNWNEETFKSNIALIKDNMRYRTNSLRGTGPAGMSEGSPYMPKGTEETPADDDKNPLGLTFPAGKNK